MFQRKKRCVAGVLRGMLACVLMVAMLFGMVPGAMEVQAAEDSTFTQECQVANRAYTYTTIDDRTVTTTTEGKPKLLVFFQTTCQFSQAGVRAICQGSYDYSSVDVVAAEFEGHSRAEVTEFKNTYGSDVAAFAYSTETTIHDNMWNYVFAAGKSGSITLPVMVYIDRNDQVRCVTAGVYDEESIVANLEKYCGVTLSKKGTDAETKDTTEVLMSVEYQQQEARRILGMVNEFRLSNPWYWNVDGQTKSYASDLKSLTYDYKLEQIAMKRAAEIAVRYSHGRANGSDCFSAFTEFGYTGSGGENIAAGTGSSLDTAEKVFTAWREEDKAYADQGHRRNMLDVGIRDGFAAIGIGHVYYQGNHYWAMELGGAVSGASDTKVDGKQTVSVEVKNEYLRQPLTIAMPDKITLGKSVSLPTVYAELYTPDTYPKTIQYMPMGAVDVKWTVADPSVAALENGSLVGKALGSTTVTATAPASGRSVTVTVNVVEAGSDNGSGDNQDGNTGNGGNTGNDGNTGNGGNTGNDGNTGNGGNTGNDENTGGGNGSQPGGNGNTGNTGNWNWNDNPSDDDQTGAISGVIEGTGSKEDTDSYGTRTLMVRPTTFKNIELSWNTVPGAKSYEIFYSTSPDSGFKRLANVKKNFYRFSKGKCGVTYYFQMRVCTKTDKSEFGPVSYGKTDLIGAPVLQVKKTTYNSVTLKWSKIAGAKKYEILYADSISGRWQSLGVKGGTSFTHKKLTTGATYYYQIRPVRDAFYGDWSNGVSTTPSLANVSKLKVKAAGPDRLKLSWKKVPGAGQYVILRSDKVDGTYEIIGYSAKTSYTDVALTSSTTYFYKVYAVSGPYKSQETAPVAQTTKAPKK